MIRLATVGTSRICNSFLEGAALSRQFALTAVYSRTEETGKAFAASHGCETVYTDLVKMAEDDNIDAVYIASPNVFHEEQSRLFLEHGKHVLCEKPIATSFAAYDALKKLADSKHLVYMEAMISMHAKAREAIKEAIGVIAPICVAKLDFCQRSSRYDAFLNGETPNIFNMRYHAGALMDIGVYCVNAAADLFGEPMSVNAEAYLLPNYADGSGYAVLQYETFPCILTYSKVGQGHGGSEIVGENGTLHIGMISQYADVTLYTGGKEYKICETRSKAEQMQAEAEDFASYILQYQVNRDAYNEISMVCSKAQMLMTAVKHRAHLTYPERNKEDIL